MKKALTEEAYLRDQVRRLNEVVVKYQELYPSSARIHDDLPGHATGGPWLTDPAWITSVVPPIDIDSSSIDNLMSPLLLEYDDSMHDLHKLLGTSRTDMASMRREMDLMSAENKRLVEEVRSLMPNLTTDEFLSDMNQPIEDDFVTKNLHQQLRTALDEKDASLEMWQASSKEVERLKSELDQLRSSQSWSVVEERANQVENQYMAAVNQIEGNLKSAHDDLRSSKGELLTANTQLDDQQRMIESLKREIACKEGDKLLGGDTTQTKINEYQSLSKALEVRLTTAYNDIADLKSQRSHWDQKITEMKAKQVELQNREADVQQQVKDSVHIVDNALLERDKAIQMVRQKEESYEKLEKTVTKLMNEEGSRTRQEVDNVRLQGNACLQKLMDELQQIEMVVIEKDSNYERLVRDKQSILATLEQMTKEGKDQSDENKMLFGDLSQRLIEAERSRDEAHMKLETMTHNTRLQEINCKQETSKQDDVIKQMNGRLKQRELEYEAINEEREKWLGQADALRVKLQTAKSEREAAIRRCNKELSMSEQDQNLLVQELKAKLTATEDNHRHAMNETRKLLTAQQKMSSRWKEECHSLTHKLEAKINNQREEIDDFKKRNNELTALLRESQHKTAQAEQMMSQYSRKFQNLAERVTEAENLGKSGTQNVSPRSWSFEKDNILRSMNQAEVDSANVSRNSVITPPPHMPTSPLSLHTSDLNLLQQKTVLSFLSDI